MRDQDMGNALPVGFRYQSLEVKQGKILTGIDGDFAFSVFDEKSIVEKMSDLQEVAPYCL